MYENTFFRKVYWTGSWSTSLVLRLWNAATMRLWNAAKCARNSLEMLASPGGFHFVCSKSVLKLCQSYSPTALLHKSLSVFKNRQKNRVENNRKIASRRIFDFFSRLLLQWFSFTISPFFCTIFQIVLLIHMPASGLGMDICVLGRVQPPVTLMPRLLFHCVAPHTLSSLSTLLCLPLFPLKDPWGHVIVV